MYKIYAFFKDFDMAEKANYIIKDMVMFSQLNEEEIRTHSVYNISGSIKVENCIYILAEVDEQSKDRVKDFLYRYGADDVIILL